LTEKHVVFWFNLTNLGHLKFGNRKTKKKNTAGSHKENLLQLVCRTQRFKKIVSKVRLEEIKRLKNQLAKIWHSARMSFPNFAPEIITRKADFVFTKHKLFKKLTTGYNQCVRPELGICEPRQLTISRPIHFCNVDSTLVYFK
jgi:hypothetical protein